MLENLKVKLKLRKYRNEIIGYAYEFFKPIETFSINYILKSYAVIMLEGEIDYIYTGYAKTPYSTLAYKLKDELEESGHKNISYWENYNIDRKLVKKRVQ